MCIDIKTALRSTGDCMSLKHYYLLLLGTPVETPDHPCGLKKKEKHFLLPSLCSIPEDVIL